MIAVARRWSRETVCVRFRRQMALLLRDRPSVLTTNQSVMSPSIARDAPMCRRHARSQANQTASFLTHITTVIVKVRFDFIWSSLKAEISRDTFVLVGFHFTYNVYCTKSEFNTKTSQISFFNLFALSKDIGLIQISACGIFSFILYILNWRTMLYIAFCAENKAIK